MVPAWRRRDTGRGREKGAIRHTLLRSTQAEFISSALVPPRYSSPPGAVCVCVCGHIVRSDGDWSEYGGSTPSSHQMMGILSVASVPMIAPTRAMPTSVKPPPLRRGALLQHRPHVRCVVQSGPPPSGERQTSRMKPPICCIKLPSRFAGRRLAVVAASSSKQNAAPKGAAKAPAADPAKQQNSGTQLGGW